MDLASTIKERRALFNLSQEDLAQMSEVGIATLKDIERGKANPSLSTISKLLDVLGMEINYRIRKTV